MKSLLHSFLLFFACVGCAHATPLWSQQEILDVLDEVIETAVGIDFGAVENSSAEPVQEPLWATPRCHLPQSSFWSEVYDRYGDSYATTLGGFRSSTANAITDGLDSNFGAPLMFGTSPNIPLTTTTVNDTLIAMANADQVLFGLYFRHRRQIGEEFEMNSSAELQLANALLCAVQRRHSEFLYELTMEQGFPSADLNPTIDIHGESAAFLLAKHIDDLEMLDRIVVQAAFSAGRGDLFVTNYGYLLDTWHVKRFGTQLVGTHTNCDAGNAIIFPVRERPDAAERIRQFYQLPSEAYLLELARPGCERMHQRPQQ